MKLVLAGFDWDEGNRGKCQKHGVSLDEIEDLFLGEPGVAPDLKHSAQETRFIAAGRTTEGRGIFVAFAIRTIAGRTFIRPISARYMHRKEVEAYEKKSS
jgi:uncharacterized DUF497 family protein